MNKKKKKEAKLTIAELEAKINELRNGKPAISTNSRAFKIKFPGRSGIKKIRYGTEGNYFKLIYTNPKS